ncbi:hypothetical protein GCM10010317_087140 [Streptomyces mirabilis]|nr:hypothetical protein GCM10010317_087140 [Streptomyces mirabilis]
MGPINYLLLLYRRVSLADGSGWLAAGQLSVEDTGKLFLELAARHLHLRGLEDVVNMKGKQMSWTRFDAALLSATRSRTVGSYFATTPTTAWHASCTPARPVGSPANPLPEDADGIILHRSAGQSLPHVFR